MGEPSPIFLFLIFAEESNIRSQRTGPTNPARSSPVPVEKASSIPICYVINLDIFSSFMVFNNVYFRSMKLLQV